SHWLWKGEQFSIDVKHQNLLDHYRAAAISRDGGGKGKKGNGDGVGNAVLHLSLPEVFMLRNIGIVRLNMLELVASAWHHSVADRDIIEKEFVRVFCPEDGEFVLENFREASGIYPSVGLMCDDYKNKRSNILPKPPTG